MTQTNKASAFETFYSFMSKETYDVFVQYIIEVWQSKLHVSSGSWNDWHPQVTGDLEVPVYVVPDGDLVYNVNASRFRIQVTTDAFGLLVTLCALRGVLLDIKDNRLPMISDTEGKQIQHAFDDLLRYAHSHAEANAIMPEFSGFDSDNSSYRDNASAHAGATVTTPELTCEIESNFSDIKQSAHKLLLKYQSGNVSRDDLYSQGAELTLKFNSLVDRYSLNFPHADDAAKLLYAVRHLSTC